MTAFIADNLPWLMALSLAILIFSGLPVAVVLAGVSLGFSLLGYAVGVLQFGDLGFIFYRVYGTLSDADQVQYAAIPALVFMGVVLAEAGIARELLTGVERLLPRTRGGLAIASTVLAVVLAPTAGVVAASVSALALIALPVMLARGYPKAFAAGSIAAAGTLGVALPPGVLLFFVADAVGVQVAAIFLGMIGPMLVLLLLHCGYQLIAGPRQPRTPHQPSRHPDGPKQRWWTLLQVLPGLVLILMIVLSIVFGWATLSESAAIGAAGALLLTLLRRSLSLEVLRRSILQTTWTTGMIFFIFVGATAFSVIFRLSGGVHQLASSVEQLQVGPAAILALVMLIVFGLGFFLDWIEIVLITYPVFKPVLDTLNFAEHVGGPSHTMLWIAVLLALNLQVSFLTPPFGFALFLTKGAAPSSIRMSDIYRGVFPYVLIYLLVIALVAAVPLLATWLPDTLLDLSIARGPRFRE